MLPITDHRGSIVGAVESDAGGTTLLAGADYTPMGRVATLDPTDDDAETCREEGNPGTRCAHPGGMPFGFAGAWRSEATGLVYMRFRWYSPTLAQFLTPDPMGEVDSWNLYAYVSGDPINRWDPWGLESTQTAKKPPKNGGEGGNSKSNGRMSSGTVGPWADRSLFFTTVAEKTKHSDEFLSVAAKAMATPFGLATGSWAGFGVYNIWNWAGRDAADDALKDAGLGDGGRFAVLFLADMGVGAAANMVGPKPTSADGGVPTTPRPAVAARPGGSGAAVVASIRGAKRGPKPFGTGPHNLKVKEVADSVTDGEIIAGGQRLPEQLIPTPGGFKSGRRPDILVRRPDRSIYGINVGRQSKRTGAPIKREAETISDLEGAGIEIHFVPYN
jgi:RHS repeat-associated protein